MLLVKLRESKSSNKFLSSRVRRWLTLSWFITLLPTLAFAQSAPPEKIGSAETWLSVLTSLIIVIGVIVTLGFLIKRLNVVQSNAAQLQVVASMMAGTRERIVVIQVGEEQHLVGITAHNINHLARLEQPISKEQAPDLLASGMRNRFAQILQKQHNEVSQHDERNESPNKG